MNNQPKISHQLVINIKSRPIIFGNREAFVDYIKTETQQGDWEKFDHLPALKVVDRLDGEEVSFKDLSKIPEAKKDDVVVESPKSKRPLIIIRK